MNQFRTWLSAASRIMHEAELIAKDGTPEATVIAMNLIRDATQIIDMCLLRRIPHIPPECRGCPHHEPMLEGNLKVVRGQVES